ncbi:hypothetical protein [Tunturiibacter gelidoferens]|jgi:hypothetical protein|uniref:Uncharacterized protein n=1 Tax=Tunturiibacter gelidiferens TaxID=3069689 RepID=A0A9X0QHH8_9BACT|nr:hypothetical protein [Edaphobacter lichenicola]MBB5330300.1 hypothetical protein [Edaphobacter lichenicola]
MNTVFNNYLLDGITNNNMTADFGNGNSFTLKPPPDGLSEFKVETANYSAEYGRSGGAVINAVTKSGQNRFSEMCGSTTAMPTIRHQQSVY